MKALHWSVLNILFFSGLTACGGDDDGKLSLAVMVRGTNGQALTAADCSVALTSAQIVLRQIELKPEDGVGEEDDHEFAVGPLLLDVAAADFNGTIQQAIASAVVPAGVYDEIDFEVHKLDDGDPKDQAAADADPALGAMRDADLSVRIVGNGFTFESSLNEEQERDVHIEVGEGSGADGITLSIDTSKWFVDPDTGACLDPQSGDHSRIEESIKRSLDVKEDDDHDGLDDVDEDDDHGSDTDD